jgi:hypothetical protein
MRTTWVFAAAVTGMTIIAATGFSHERFDLQRLTVPSDRLPPGCALAPRRMQTEDGRTRGSMWAGLPIPTNPWWGTDRDTVATVHERMGNSARIPDGPVLTKAEAARLHLTLAEGIEDAYAAIYIEKGHEELIVVHACRFEPNHRSRETPITWRDKPNPRLVEVKIGSIVATVTGDGGACFQAVGAHLKTLAH